MLRQWGGFDDPGGLANVTYRCPCGHEIELAGTLERGRFLVVCPRCDRRSSIGVGIVNDGFTGDSAPSQAQPADNYPPLDLEVPR